VIEGVCAKLDLAPSIEKKNNKANHKNLFPSKLCTVLSPLFWFYFVKTALGGEAVSCLARPLRRTARILNPGRGWGHFLGTIIRDSSLSRGSIIFCSIWHHLSQRTRFAHRRLRAVGLTRTQVAFAVFDWRPLLGGTGPFSESHLNETASDSQLLSGPEIGQ